MRDAPVLVEATLDTSAGVAGAGEAAVESVIPLGESAAKLSTAKDTPSKKRDEAVNNRKPKNPELSRLFVFIGPRQTIRFESLNEKKPGSERGVGFSLTFG